MRMLSHRTPQRVDEDDEDIAKRRGPDGIGR